jgi:hypothetical protein
MMVQGEKQNDKNRACNHFNFVGGSSSKCNTTSMPSRGESFMVGGDIGYLAVVVFVDFKRHFERGNEN